MKCQRAQCCSIFSPLSGVRTYRVTQKASAAAGRHRTRRLCSTHNHHSRTMQQRHQSPSSADAAISLISQNAHPSFRATHEPHKSSLGSPALHFLFSFVYQANHEKGVVIYSLIERQRRIPSSGSMEMFTRRMMLMSLQRACHGSSRQATVDRLTLTMAVNVHTRGPAWQPQCSTHTTTHQPFSIQILYHTRSRC
jgi:hypothetical protein